MASPRVILTCKHQVDFEPPATIGDEVYCRKCATYRTVEREIEGLIRAHCRQCPYTRYYGTDETQAGMGASRHSLRYTTHDIDIERDGSVIRTISMKDEATLPFAIEAHKGVKLSTRDKALIRNFVNSFQV